MLTLFFDGVDRPAHRQWDDEEGAATSYSSSRTYVTSNCGECHVGPEVAAASVPRGYHEPYEAPTAAATAAVAASPFPEQPQSQGAAIGPAPPAPTPSMEALSPPMARTHAGDAAPPNAKTTSESLARPGDAPGIYVQVAAFTDTRNAAALKSKLEPTFAGVYLDELPAHGQTWYRVRIGPLASDAEADGVEQRLRALGQEPLRYGNAQAAR